ncbi:hypothetical protein T01_9153 [Trichinella spiralis]|uniref:Uncharacterized protein n=1 Tax=Trichinella spiralis TaxID=6334 RepID=A0A0V1ALB5_TRISP|nr:hypothetical protein T01_9153 [Trichinella spiralis]
MCQLKNKKTCILHENSFLMWPFWIILISEL